MNLIQQLDDLQLDAPITAVIPYQRGYLVFTSESTYWLQRETAWERLRGWLERKWKQILRKGRH